MAFNEKALKNLRPRQVGLDDIDRQAEREAIARGFFRDQVGSPILGRRSMRQNRESNGNRTTADAKATKYLVRETAKVARAVIIGKE